MKTIWILNHHAVTPDIGGGTRHYDFAKELVGRGYRVYIFASSYIHNKYVNILNDNETARELSIDGINWIWINTRAYCGNGKDRILGMIQYYRFMMSNYNTYPKPDVVIGSAVHLLACVAACRISKKLGAYCISEIRDLWPETLIELGSVKRNSMTAKVMYLLEKYVYAKTEKIIVTAPGMVDYIEERGINRNKIVYINNGVDVRSFDARKNEYHCKEIGINLNSQRFNAVYLGSFGKANALDTIIEAAIMLREKDDICFTLIGDGPDKERLKDNVENIRLENIQFFPSVPKHYVPDILTHADCLVFSAVDSPLYKYGISANKIFDYLCSGKPIVFAINSLNDIVRSSECGLSITPERPVEMANAIVRLYNMDTEERVAMGKKGRYYVEQNFDIPILVDKLEEVINEW